MKNPERRTSLGVFFKDQQHANHSKEQQSFFLASPISNTSYAFSLNDKSSVAESVSVYLDDDKSPNDKKSSSRRRNSSLENLFLDPLDAKTNKKKDGEKHRKKKSSGTKKKKKKAQEN